ncbi:MAG: hypothetical protein J5833_06800, partial [Victivallales bacterium]|nr:hypothetical protein [Victivallales bacterium]
MKRLPASLLLLAAFAFAGIRIDVQNGRHLRFQQVVDVKLTAEQYDSRKGLVLNEIEPSGLKTAVPFECSVEKWEDGETEYVLSILMTGLTQPNAVRTFEFSEGEHAEIATDMTSGSDTAASWISNQYFSLEHQAKGNGGIFSKLHFMHSGTDDNDLTLHDRCFTKELGSFHIKDDKDAEARIISSSPLRTVVEAKTRYIYHEKAAQGDLRAVYHYAYNAFSPVVTVRMKVFRDDETDWRELHFLHLTSLKRKYDRFVMGDKGGVKIHDLLPLGTKSFGAIGASDWCVMEDRQNAVGVGGGAIAWDASSVYSDFIRSDKTNRFLKDLKGVDVTTTLYFGPASGDRTAYAKWLAPAEQPKATVRSDVSSVVNRGEFKGEHILENNDVRIAFSGAADGFACVGIERADHKGPVFCNAKGYRRPLWKLHFRKGTDAETATTVNGNDVPAEKASVERIENGLKFVWKGVAIGGGTFDAVAKVVLNGGQSEWMLEIDNHSNEYGLWDSEFPIMGNVLARGTGDAVVPHGNWGGSLYHNYNGGYNGTYPSAGAPL